LKHDITEVMETSLAETEDDKCREKSLEPLKKTDRNIIEEE